MRFISQWKDAYDLSEFAHCISKDFEDVKTELFTYHIATDETGLNSMFRYRVNICLRIDIDNVMATTFIVFEIILKQEAVTFIQVFPYMNYLSEINKLT